MFLEQRTKPIDVWDHTNAMGCGFACMLITPFVIGFVSIIAVVIHALYGAIAWILLPVALVAVPASWVWIYVSDSKWTREEAAEHGRELEWDQSI